MKRNVKPRKIDKRKRKILVLMCIITNTVELEIFFKRHKERMLIDVIGEQK